MRIYILTFTMLLLSLTTIAQVKFTDSTLAESIKQAQKENKVVMIMASTTWCGPCKVVEKQFLSQEEFTNHFKDKFIYQKYLLDVSDSDKIVETYGVNVYPTFIFIGGDGCEITRMTGGAADLEAFIKRIDDVLSPENTIKAQEEKFKSNPAYAMEYISFLTRSHLTSKIDDVLEEMLRMRPVESTFTPEWIEYYTKNVRSINSPVMTYMLANASEVSRVMGKESYEFFMQTKGISFLQSVLFTPMRTAEKTYAVVNEIKKHKVMTSDYSKYVVKYTNELITKDLLALEPVVESLIVKCDSPSRKAMLSSLSECLPINTIAEYKAKVIALYTKALSYEQDASNKESFTKTINQLTNSEKKVVHRMN